MNSIRAFKFSLFLLLHEIDKSNNYSMGTTKTTCVYFFDLLEREEKNYLLRVSIQSRSERKTLTIDLKEITISFEEYIT